MNACHRSIRIEWGQALHPSASTSLAPWPLGENNTTFLTQVGLPARAADGGNLVIHFHAAEAFHLIHVGAFQGTCVGETDVGVAVWIDARMGHVWAGDVPDPMFLNTSLETLLCCMAMYRREFVACPLSAEDEGESDDEDLPGTPATRARADQLRVRLNAIDPLALEGSAGGQGVSMWGYVVEEIEAGVI